MEEVREKEDEVDMLYVQEHRKNRYQTACWPIARVPFVNYRYYLEIIDARENRTEQNKAHNREGE